MHQTLASIRPAAVTIVDIDDAASAWRDIELLDMDAVQLKSMPCRVRRVIVRLDACAVVFHSTNARVRTRTRVQPGMVAYAAFAPNTQGTVNGVTVHPRLMVSAAPWQTASFVAEPGWESLSFLVGARDLRDRLTSCKGMEGFRLPQGVEALQVDRDKVRVLYDWGRRLVRAAESDPFAFERGRDAPERARRELFEHLLSTLQGARASEPSAVERTRQARSRIVQLAEDHAMSRIEDRLQVSDLCRAAGVSERSLEYAFKDVLGLSPVSYLLRLRLHRVRQALLATTSGASTVSGEALKWGFGHFGDFSQAYKECFGELPSQTLRRPPDAMRQAVAHSPARTR